ncbi:unnamed protein product [Lathyrus sativus]|nr:unnamed protein product [Lathyrus sativus]
MLFLSRFYGSSFVCSGLKLCCGTGNSPFLFAIEVCGSSRFMSSVCCGAAACWRLQEMRTVEQVFCVKVLYGVADHTVDARIVARRSYHFCVFLLQIRLCWRWKLG